MPIDDPVTQRQVDGLSFCVLGPYPFEQMTTARKVTPGEESAVPLRVDYIRDEVPRLTSVLHCTDTEGTELRVAVQESSTIDVSLKTDTWYEFAGVARSESPETHLRVSAGDDSVQRIEPPERRTHPRLTELDAPWITQLNASDERIAVTVQPRPADGTEDIRVEDPETFEIGAVCFAHCDRSGEPAVYHRMDPDTRDEHLLLEHVVEDLSETDGAALVTCGGDSRPVEMLFRRLEQASGGDTIASDAEQVLAECFHATPESVAVRAEVDTLADAAHQRGIDRGSVRLSDYDIGIDPADWRENWDIDQTALSDVSDPQMTDRDYATLIEWHVGTEDGTVDSTQLAHCLKAYASADLDLLRGLVAHGTMDCLGCPRLSTRLPER